MSDFDDQIESMTIDLLAEVGRSFVYRRGTTSATITLRMSRRQSVSVESQGGHVVEVYPVDFIALTSALPFDPPRSGDVIVNGTDEYELLPTTSEKVFRRINERMTRLHTKQVR